jgi:hypothetical protein
MAERLYGVYHNRTTFNLGPFPMSRVDMHPSRHLVDYLSGLPKGSRVGIEEIDPAQAFQDDDYGLEPDPYWVTLRNHIDDLGLVPVYLDDIDLIKKAKMKYYGAHKFALDYQILKGEVDSGQGSFDDIVSNRLRFLREAEFIAYTQGDYILEVEREQYLVDRVKQENPDVVVLGVGHTDPLILTDGLLEVGLGEVNYYKEEWDFDLMLNYDNTPLDAIGYISQTPDPERLKHRQSLARRHSSVSLGRILPEKTPDFIGTWNPDCRPAGLFEIYLDHLQGGPPYQMVIEDNIGTANGFGGVALGEVGFNKNYIPSKSVKGAASGTILYRGRLGDNGIYYGQFNNSSGIRGQFTMNEGGILLDPGSHSTKM